MENAIPPGNQVFKIFKKIQETRTEVKTAEIRDASIGSLSTDPRWLAFKKEIEERIESLRTMEGAIDPHDTVEAVGFRFLAVSLAIAELRAIAERPDAIVSSLTINEQPKK